MVGENQWRREVEGRQRRGKMRQKGVGEMCRVRRPLQLAFKMQEGGHKAGM